ncbi:peptidoglycan editing factor PgeF [Streptomonospora wellingtoniae]|uniref:Purine nucleoside phosphorylase n=1 Tax=Streptomonospora wellingtoniae TaxID=3075544 RepID=A0ABU2KPF1_9ACTN|nr:peptidoglycan editing factor PgeF [Streptomonospora sp. DSM 45055]MDT0301157.1 peptidoglycan editing factor PgeF [Streptomonospora sp. DSM 45055]
MSAVIELGPGVQAAFTRRYDGGVSSAPFDSLNLGHGVDDAPAAVAENRRTAAKDLGFAAERVVWMDQVHSADVAVATEPGTAGRVDAVVSDRPDLVLAALAADCLLVLAADAEAGVVGAAHSGRLGTQAGVAPAMIARMALLGADPARIAAVLGPAICGRCYEVGPQVQAEMARRVPEAASRTREGTEGIDMRAAVTAQLRAADVGHITSDDRCTLESPELFSHRGGAPTGRFAGFVWRRP